MGTGDRIRWKWSGYSTTRSEFGSSPHIFENSSVAVQQLYVAQEEETNMTKQFDVVNSSKGNVGAVVQETDGQFFDALMRSDVEALDRIASDDFIIIDVLRGADTTMPEIIGAIRSGLVQFEKIEIIDNRVRFYDRTVVIPDRLE